MKKTLVVEYFSKIEDTLINQVILEIEKAAVNGFERVVLLIASTGGDTDAGIKGYNYLKSMIDKIQIITFNVGFVESAAISLYCGGEERYAVPTSHFLIHQARQNYSSYTVNKIKNEIKLIKENNKRSISVIKDNVVQSNRKVLEAYYAGTTLSPKEAENWGLINAQTNGIDDNYFKAIGSNYEYFSLYK
ncbi:ATP-dependent Clp protease proteolytic subunit [Bacillus sp. OK048]|uniref:ATP-dependent Clp protease proteolytic subunit n=1 Tax=Bacillus sp. OK048 TaxID=1882761 RepID=UPI00087FDA03|nr:ATP-dependent Clp protease proteolytic subunit [Bacillus sp. OK048]SDN62898.1 ATP-dependent protease ClpP, protease subunit [Bacillus sp. OK048]